MSNINLVLPQQRQEDIEGLNLVLGENSKENMVVVELGSFTGASTITMLPHVIKNNGKMYCVDLWHELDQECTCNDIYNNYDVINIFRENIKAVGGENHVIMVVGDSISPVREFANHSVDILFADADHRYDGVKRDIFSWYSKVKNGGIIMSHDYTKAWQDCDPDFIEEHKHVDHIEGVHYGVIALAKKYFPECDKAGRIFYIQKTQELTDRLNRDYNFELI